MSIKMKSEKKDLFSIQNDAPLDTVDFEKTFRPVLRNIMITIWDYIYRKPDEVYVYVRNDKNNNFSYYFLVKIGDKVVDEKRLSSLGIDISDRLEKSKDFIGRDIVRTFNFFANHKKIIPTEIFAKANVHTGKEKVELCYSIGEYKFKGIQKTLKNWLNKPENVFDFSLNLEEK